MRDERVAPIGAASRAFRRVISVCLLMLSVIVVTPSSVLVIARISHYERSLQVIVLEAFTTYVFIPDYLAFAYAVITRRKALASISGLLVVCHVLWVFPEYATQTASSKNVSQSVSHLRLLTQNVRFDNPSSSELARNITNNDPDVIFLQELSYPVFDALQQTGALDPYPYRMTAPSYSVMGMGTFSKTPLIDARTVATAGWPDLTADTIINGHRVNLYNVHVRAPVDGGPQHWYQQLASVRDYERTHAGQVVIAGDFNATWGHGPLRSIATNGYRDAAIDLGRGYSRTWPVDTALARKIGGLIRIDHVFVSRGVQPIRADENPGRGSDHKAIIVDLALT